MKKILILSDYFPPCNLTPAERIFSFAKYLKEFGYSPVVVTRNWDIPIEHPKDERKSTGIKLIHEKNEFYEVYYVPYNPTLRERFFEKFFGTKFYFIYLAVSLVYSIGEQFSSHFTSFLPLYRQCRYILKKDKNFSFLLISGSPFHLFKFGYKLKKEFGIKWIADYRDDWNTNEVLTNSGLKAVANKAAKSNEIKWVNSATFFITVSDHYVKKIAKFLGTMTGHTILNGFLRNNYKNLVKKNSTSFSIIYVGSLYISQPIEIFLEGYIAFINQMPDIHSTVTFVGMKTQPQELSKIKQITKGFEKRFKYTYRLPKQETILIQNDATLLLICAHPSFKGTPGSKLYEYVALKKPVLVCPSDNEIIEETLTETGQGYFANSVQECTQKLKELYTEYGTDNGQAKKIKEKEVEKYSRYESVKKFAKLLDKEIRGF